MPGRGNSNCEGSESGMNLASARDSKVARVEGTC